MQTFTYMRVDGADMMTIGDTASRAQAAADEYGYDVEILAISRGVTQAWLDFETIKTTTRDGVTCTIAEAGVHDEDHAYA